MNELSQRQKPGTVRDAIFNTLSGVTVPLSVSEIHKTVNRDLGSTPRSSIQSYLRNNIGNGFSNPERGKYILQEPSSDCSARELPNLFEHNSFNISGSRVFNQNCFDWLEHQNPNTIHAFVTDPPYGLVEFSDKEKQKLRAGNGGVWRIPPSFDGNKRSPLPRFTTLSQNNLDEISSFFEELGYWIHRAAVPGANVVVASNPLVSHIVSTALVQRGLERRGELIRLVMTMRGGDRPKAAHEEFEDVSVMPRSMWEPWLIFRKPVEGRVQDNLRKWKTGGFRRPSKDKPFGDVIKSSPARGVERSFSKHPNLKPQAFMRQLVRGVLPLGEGLIVDPFSGSGSTIAAAVASGYSSIGIEKDEEFFENSKSSIPKLAAFEV